jgi:hypothetical protein
MNVRTPTLALAALCACLALPSFAAGTPKAASGAAAQAQAQYKRDLAVCDSNRATEDRATCRTEAQRAYAEARAGKFAGSQDQYTQNARARCEALKGIDRTACEERMSGEGTVQGSVAGGGILREKTITVPAK